MAAVIQRGSGLEAGATLSGQLDVADTLHNTPWPLRLLNHTGMLITSSHYPYQSVCMWLPPLGLRGLFHAHMREGD